MLTGVWGVLLLDDWSAKCSCFTMLVFTPTVKSITSVTDRYPYAVLSPNVCCWEPCCYICVPICSFLLSRCPCTFVRYKLACVCIEDGMGREMISAKLNKL